LHRRGQPKNHPFASQGWINEVIEDLDQLVSRVVLAKANKEVISIAYLGNVVDVWEKFDQENIQIDLGSDQTSLHNPWAGGYYLPELRTKLMI
jgi:urocanate hydratase